MKNLKNVKNMDAPSKPVTRREKKGLSASIYIWIGLVLVISCIPLLNFFLIPWITFLGIGAYAIYRLAKESKQKKPGTLAREEKDSVGEFIHASPGLTATRHPPKTKRKKSGTHDLEQ